MLKRFFNMQPLKLAATTRDRFVRFLCDPAAAPSVNEQKMVDILKDKFPKAVGVEVKDISGGCGAMFEIYVVSEEFKGLSRVKQHQLVTQALKNEIKEMHGCRVFTSVEM